MKNYRISVNGKSYDVCVEELGGSAAPAAAPIAAPVSAPAAAPVAAAPAAAPAPAAVSGATNISAPMPGTIMKLNVSVGDAVKAGDVLLVFEAMKMENDLAAPVDGKVVAVNTSKGATINTGDVLVSIS